MHKFSDEARIHVEAGNGGDGAISFRREKFVAKGGPDGGDGGDGGDVVLVADHNVTTLSDLTRKKIYRAPHGDKGIGQKSTGKTAEDLEIAVPVGTEVLEVTGEGDDEQLSLLADLSKDGQRFMVAQGGKGGFGNYRFARPSFKVPRFAELGEPGEEKDLVLKLKLIADVGLVGLPNAGKSTLLSVVSNAKPKIADYAFTTLIPNLGIARWKNATFVAADIPGLIEGAASGKGLGFQFLRHIERTRLLVHLLDSTRPDPKADFTAINTELATYSKELAKRPQIVVLNKIDRLTPAELTQIRKLKFGKLPVVYASGVSQEGVGELLDKIILTLSQLPKPVSKAPAKVFGLADVISSRFEIQKQDDLYLVSGHRQERLAIRTDFENPQAMGRFYKVLNRMGVIAALQKAGAKPGDMVKIGSKEFVYENIV